MFLVRGRRAEGCLGIRCKIRDLVLWLLRFKVSDFESTLFCMQVQALGLPGMPKCPKIKGSGKKRDLWPSA